MSIQHMQMRSDMRSVDTNGEKYIEGYFAVFNQDYTFYKLLIQPWLYP